MSGAGGPAVSGVLAAASAVVEPAVRSVRWYLREIDGTARWEAYLEHCRSHGHTPVSRGAFERARCDAKAATPGARCC